MLKKYFIISNEIENIILKLFSENVIYFTDIVTIYA